MSAESALYVTLRASVPWSVAAMKSMEDVAEHINEMQRIHDEYGQIFDELSHSRRTADTAAAVGLYDSTQTMHKSLYSV